MFAKNKAEEMSKDSIRGLGLFGEWTTVKSDSLADIKEALGHFIDPDSVTASDLRELKVTKDLNLGTKNYESVELKQIDDNLVLVMNVDPIEQVNRLSDEGIYLVIDNNDINHILGLVTEKNVRGMSLRVDTFKHLVTYGDNIYPISFKDSRSLEYDLEDANYCTDDYLNLHFNQVQGFLSQQGILYNYDSFMDKLDSETSIG